MARYIDAAEPIRKIMKLIEKVERCSAEHCAYAEAIVQIDRTSTADVAEVKHGEWIDTGDEILDTTYSGWKCSECGYIFCGSQTNYCPNCGAKMDGGNAE